MKFTSIHSLHTFFVIIGKSFLAICRASTLARWRGWRRTGRRCLVWLLRNPGLHIVICFLVFLLFSRLLSSSTLARWRGWRRTGRRCLVWLLRNPGLHIVICLLVFLFFSRRGLLRRVCGW